MLSPHWADACDEALQRFYAATLALEGASTAQQSNPLDQAWQWFVGSSSGPLAGDAHGTRLLYETMVAKRERLTSDAEAELFVRDVGSYVDVSDALETARMLSFQGGASEVAGDTLADLASGVKTGIAVAGVGTLMVAGFVLVVLLLSRK